MNEEELFINLIPSPCGGGGLSLEWLVDPVFAVWAGLDGVD
jgi:hypothetical protein